MERSRSRRRHHASARRWLAVATLVALAQLGAARRAGAQAVVGCAADPATRAAELVAAVADAVGAGPRTITLAAGCVYTLTAPTADGNGLPVIASGAQRSALTIAGNGATIERADATPRFRFFALAKGNSLTLNDLTLRGGASRADSTDDGGAIRSAGQLVLHRCTLTANAVRSNCDAAYGGNGGAVAVLDGSAEIDDTVLSENTAGCGIVGGNGGAIYAAPSGDGGGTASISLVITRTTIVGNTAGQSLAHKDPAAPGSGHGGDGGGLFLGSGSPASISQSTFADNDAGNGGPSDDQGANGGDGGDGGAIASAGTLTIVNCTIYGNMGGFGAGTIPPYGRGGRGGGLYAFDGSTNLLGSTTLSHNLPRNTFAFGEDGGAIVAEPGAIVRAHNSVFELGTPPASPHQSLGDCDGDVVDDGGNVQSWGGCGATIPVGDPRLAALASNGGPTETQALLAGSAAIGAGDAASCPAVDQRGVRRLGDCDSGAYQHSGVPHGPFVPIQRGGGVLPHVTFPLGTR